MPDVDLFPFPVVSEHVNVGWASDLRIARLIGGEYVKYIGSLPVHTASLRQRAGRARLASPAAQRGFAVIGLFRGARAA